MGSDSKMNKLGQAKHSLLPCVNEAAHVAGYTVFVFTVKLQGINHFTVSGSEHTVCQVLLPDM